MSSTLQTDIYPTAPLNTADESGNSRKKALGIAAATLLLGGAAWAISKKITDGPGGSDTASEPAEPGAPAAESTSAAVTLPPDVDVAGKVVDSMSFEQAFEAARNEVGMGGVFSWHGHWYNTFEKGEWGSLSLEQRREYTEMILQEKLPVITTQADRKSQPPATSTPDVQNVEPIIIEGFLNGQRVMGLDYDHDGTIDSMVIDGSDGYNYHIVDQTGDDGLDTALQYNSLTGELVAHTKFDKPFVLSNDEFGDHLEDSMSREIVTSILEPETESSVQTVSATSEVIDEPVDDEPVFNPYEEDDDSYNNHGDVHEMDE